MKIHRAIRAVFGMATRVAVLTVAVTAAGQATAQQAGSQNFQLWNDYFGNGQNLDVINGGEYNYSAWMQPKGPYTGQYWELVDSGREGFYKIRNLFAGPSMCLDIVNGGPFTNSVHLAPCGPYTGQFWQLATVSGRFVLKVPLYLGPDMCLDISGVSPRPLMAVMAPCNDAYPAQHWTMAR